MTRPQDRALFDPKPAPVIDIPRPSKESRAASRQPASSATPAPPLATQTADRASENVTEVPKPPRRFGAKGIER